MKAEYRVICEQLFCRELGAYHSFGIYAAAADGRCACIPDIATQEHRVRTIVDRLNQMEVSIQHVLDVVLDDLE